MNQNEQPLIAILSHDKKNIIGCRSVKSAPIFAPGKGPKFVLNGVDRISVFGEHTVLLGLYAEEADIEAEIREIAEAIARGERTYTLRHCADTPFGAASEPADGAE